MVIHAAMMYQGCLPWEVLRIPSGMQPWQWMDLPCQLEPLALLIMWKSSASLWNARGSFARAHCKPTPSEWVWNVCSHTLLALMNTHVWQYWNSSVRKVTFFPVLVDFTPLCSDFFPLSSPAYFLRSQSATSDYASVLFLHFILKNHSSLNARSWDISLTSENQPNFKEAS